MTKYRATFTNAAIIFAASTFLILSSQPFRRSGRTEEYSSRRLNAESLVVNHDTNDYSSVHKDLHNRYMEDGFVVVRNVIPNDASAELVEILKTTDMFAQPESNIVRKLLSSVSKTLFHPSESFQSVADMLYLSNMAEVGKQIVKSKNLYHFFDALYIKAPGQRGGSWHRDYPVSRVVKDLDTMVSFWVPLTRTNGGEEGGAMVMARGSHKWGFEEGCTGLDHIGGELVHEEWEGYTECLERLEDASVALPPLEPGDVVIFHPGLFHRTAASYGLEKEKPRVALSLVAVTDDARFQADQTRYECNVKPRLAYALDASGMQDGDLLSKMKETLLPKLEPRNVRQLLRLSETILGTQRC